MSTNGDNAEIPGGKPLPPNGENDSSDFPKPTDAKETDPIGLGREIPPKNGAGDSTEKTSESETPHTNNPADPPTQRRIRRQNQPAEQPCGNNQRGLQPRWRLQ